MMSPCKGCKRRTQNGKCHSTCEDYKLFRERLDRQNKAIHDENTITDQCHDLMYMHRIKKEWVRGPIRWR